MKSKKSPQPSTEAEYRLIPLDKIRELPGTNPNHMTAAQFEQLKSNIREYGFLQPIVVYPDETEKDGYILSDGAHRIQAMRELGRVLIPSMVATKDTALDVVMTVARTMRLAMNQLRGQSPIDKLASEITELSELGMDREQLLSTGVSKEELDAIMDCSAVDFNSILEDISNTKVDPAPELEGGHGRCYKITFKFSRAKQKAAVLDYLATNSYGCISIEEQLLQTLGLED